MRFIHLSDVGLGKNTESGKFWGRDRAVEIVNTLRKTVDKAASTACELLIISGGLFSHQPVSSELEEINRLFLSIPAVEVIIVAGESDVIKKNSPVNSFLWAPNVHYVLSYGIERIEFKKFNASVYAMSVSDKQEDNLPGFKSLLKEAFSESQETICMIASAEPNYNEVISVCNDLENEKYLKRISYAALGGMARHQEVSMSKVYYSGGLEPSGMQDTGEHGFYIGDISNATGQLIKLEFVPIAETSYISLNIEVDENTTATDLLEKIKNEMDNRGRKNIYRIHIFGKKNPDENFQPERLENEYRIAEIIDESEPQYDFSLLFQEHPQDMIGYYISKLIKNEGEISEIERKAMFYGIDALLKTSEQKGKE